VDPIPLQSEFIPAYPVTIYETSSTQRTYPNSPLTEREATGGRPQTDFTPTKTPNKDDDDFLFQAPFQMEL